MRIAALMPFGNPEASDNWEVMSNPVIQVLPLPTTTRGPQPTPTLDPNDPPIIIGPPAEG
jgi:hypothetical protein